MFSGSSSRTPGPPRSTRRTSSPATTSHQPGQPAAEHDAAGAAGAAVLVDREPVAEPEGGRAGPVAQEGQPALLLLRRTRRGEHCRGDHGRHERPGGDGAAHGLRHDHELREPVPRPAHRLGQVQPEPAECRPAGPRTAACPRRPPRAGRGRGPRPHRREELGGHALELPVLLTDRCAHDRVSLIVRLGRWGGSDGRTRCPSTTRHSAVFARCRQRVTLLSARVAEPEEQPCPTSPQTSTTTRGTSRSTPIRIRCGDGCGRRCRSTGTRRTSSSR